VSEDFDIGPLTWVKDEIDNSLDSVLECLSQLNGDEIETAVIRNAKTQLYQATGALDMVGLEGCKFFASELEKCLLKIEQGELPISLELTEQLAVAVKALKAYLNGLMQGSPDIPVKLFPELAPVISACGRELEKSELFFVDTTNAAPKDIPSQEVSDDNYKQIVTSQRLVYQKSLLQWLQTQQDLPLKSMVEALRQVCYIQTRSAPKTLWWVASAFSEALIDSDVSKLPASKRLCRKIDQELKSLQETSPKANPQMLKDMLYFVAISGVKSDGINQVKKTFNLNDYFQQTEQVAKPITLQTDELEVVAQLLSTVENIGHAWDDLSSSIDFNSDIQTSTVAVDNVLVTKCVDSLGEQLDIAKKLSQVVVFDLFHALFQAMQYMNDHQESATRAALIELASGIHLQNALLKNYADINANFVQKALSQTQRLEQISSGQVVKQFAYERTTELDLDTIKVVVNHVQDSLKVVEQSLDNFFRNPSDKSTLSIALRPIGEVSATFHMMDMQVAAEIAKVSKAYIDYFQSSQFETNEGEFELLAESLSMLGMYAEEMPKVKPEYEVAMQSALKRMQVLLENFKSPEVEVFENITEVIELTDVTVPDTNTVTDVAFDEELLDIYLTEAEEVLGQIAEHLQVLKTSGSPDSLMETRRGYHTLKGSGRTVGLTHVGEVAGKVEAFLNKLIDKNGLLNTSQIVHLEAMTSNFAGWTAQLKESQQLQFNIDEQLAEIETWANLETKAPQKVETEFILIGGIRELSRQFFNIFLNESMVNITILEQDLAKTSETPGLAPSDKARHAVHTLASNALAAGFQHMGDLGRAVELWLDETNANWTTPQQKIYSRLIKALARMWQSVSEHKEPAEQKALIRAIQKDTPSLQQATIQPANLKSTLEQLPSIESIDAFDVPTFNNDVALINTLDDTSLIKDDSDNEISTTDSSEDNIEKNNTHVSTVLHEHEDDVDPEILALFTEEADELVPTIGNDLRSWNRAHDELDHADAIQRALHTLKGSARMANKHQLGDIVHNMEERIVQALKANKVEQQLFDYLFIDFDNIAHLVEHGQLHPISARATPSDSATVYSPKPIEHLTPEVAEKEAPATHKVSETNDNLEDAIIDEKQDISASQQGRRAQMLRMRADDLDRLINEAGEISIIRSRVDKELLGFKHTSSDLTESVTRMKNYLRELEIEAEKQLQSRLTILNDANETFDPLEFDRFTRLQELTRMMAESVNDINTIQTNLIQNLGQAEAALQQQNRMNRELQQSLMRVRMLPFSLLSDRLYRLVRQTSRELNKVVEFSIDGDKTEIDRSVLDKIGAPLEHILRNAVAHGIEMPTARIEQSKKEAGTLKLKVVSENDEIKISIQDDGAGINLKKVKEVAVKNQLISKDAQLTDQELTALIFETGFSTSDSVSQIAGRGVGMDVVKNEVAALGGRIDIESHAGQGTLFSIYLPVSLTVAQVLLVSVNNTQFAVSVSMIEQAQKIKKEVLSQAFESGYIEWNGQQYPIHYLGKLLRLPRDYVDQSYASVLLVRSGHYRLALLVDEMLGNQEVVVKAIGDQLARVPGLIGATVTGEGAVILIINPITLANREALVPGALAVKVNALPTEINSKLKALVVDDSLTMRKVLGRLMEREGYEVLVAKDGMDAMQMLQTTVPDVILTDIEMPRMDGFGLARNIRDDERTKTTPLIMISSRTAEKHQNLANEIGVDAFFGKPVQDDELIAKVKELLAQKSQMH
jgi:chemosensory pili system protein ChpA (sensor histidine kinase/response regulator)